jgi:ubiquinone/menaquinone biosynthesis C-methylase UbiE
VTRQSDPRDLRSSLEYTSAWTRDEDLDSLNRRIHDGVPLELLLARARGYRNTFFDDCFPFARPAPGAAVLELGSGVGWIMQAMLERFRAIRLVGLDISENMVRRARERFADPRARFVVYDGVTFPFTDSTFDNVYSCATLQHIDKPIVFLLLDEVRRVLKPGGHATLHFLSVHHMSRDPEGFRRECLHQVRGNLDQHRHHYYSYDELFVIFHDLLQVDDLDLRHFPSPDNFLVHFSKGTGTRVRRPGLIELTYPQRVLPERAGRLRRRLRRLVS